MFRINACAESPNAAKGCKWILQKFTIIESLAVPAGLSRRSVTKAIRRKFFIGNL